MHTSEQQIGFSNSKLRQSVHPLDMTGKIEMDTVKSPAKAADEPVSEEEGLRIANRIEYKLRRYEAAKVEIRQDGTVVTTANDGSRSEFRPNGTIIAYFRDGSVKFFRTGCWSG